ncbi:13594_t:CDS:2, partial [Gigaspora margarita]
EFESNNINISQFRTCNNYRQRQAGKHKNLAEIMKVMKDIDKYNWVYNHHYMDKKLNTYWYFCSQRDISINEVTQMAEVTLYYKDLHDKPMDVSIQWDTKDFIINNIAFSKRDLFMSH